MNTDPKDQEQIWHKRLRALPDLPAPAELIPNVLQRLAATESLPWHRRPWLEWPRPLQVCSAFFLAGLIGAAYAWRDGFMSRLRLVVEWLPGSSVPGESWQKAQTLWHALEHSMAALQFPYLAVAAAVVLALYLSVFGVGAVFYRLATHQQVTST